MMPLKIGGLPQVFCMHEGTLSFPEGDGFLNYTEMRLDSENPGLRRGSGDPLRAKSRGAGDSLRAKSGAEEYNV
jgi:hypothetical protein